MFTIANKEIPPSLSVNRKLTTEDMHAVFPHLKSFIKEKLRESLLDNAHMLEESHVTFVQHAGGDIDVSLSKDGAEKLTKGYDLPLQIPVVTLHIRKNRNELKLDFSHSHWWDGVKISAAKLVLPKLSPPVGTLAYGTSKKLSDVAREWFADVINSSFEAAASGPAGGTEAE